MRIRSGMRPDGAPPEAPVVLALWSLAVAQPLLDLFGKNPEFFVVNDFSRLEIVVFALSVALGVPVVLVVVQVVADAVDTREPACAVHHGRGRAAGHGASPSWCSASSDVEDTVIVFPSPCSSACSWPTWSARAIRCGTGLALPRPRPRSCSWSPSWLSPRPPSSSAGGIAGTSKPGVVGEAAPVVMLSMDEFPVASLLRADGTINAERFPNFARLAERSSWYRNATSVAPLTQQSVPATLTGASRRRVSSRPRSDHPRSIFTLLGDAYDQHVEEQMTDVCPRRHLSRTTDGLFDLDRLRHGAHRRRRGVRPSGHAARASASTCPRSTGPGAASSTTPTPSGDAGDGEAGARRGE